MTIEEVRKTAGEKAVTEGYDQVIFKNRKGEYDFKRSTSSKNIKPKKVICYIRLFYKDGVLEPRICEM